MDRTPKSKISLFKPIQSDKCDIPVPENLPSSDNVRTPIQNRLSTVNDNDYSPLYVPCTQEAFDQLDVVWDWNSPQSKHKPKVATAKRLHNHDSPKVPIRKHPSNHQVESCDKLRTELEALKNQLARGSRAYDRSFSKVLFENKTNIEDGESKDLNNLFEDDSLEEEMILQSQRIEELFTKEIKNNACDRPDSPTIQSNMRNTPSRSDLRKVKSDSLITPLVNGTMNKKTNSSSNIRPQEIIGKHNDSVNNQWSNMKDDSFDIAIESFIDDQLIINEPVNHKQILNKSMKGKCDKLDVQKKCNINEIERKRLQAIAKLKSRNAQVVPSKTICGTKEAKSNKDNNHIYEEETSPIKCSPEEIEQKRLQALAKLQAKKKQEQIERNRKEALKRLEMNKKKRAMASQKLYDKNKII